jgi:hypothetical protein
MNSLLLFAADPVVDPAGLSGGLKWFQVVAVVVLAALFVRDLVNWSRSPASLLARLIRLGVWVGAAVAIAIPGLVQEVAYLLGIGRGADVVLYVFVLAFLWTAFYLYARCLRLEREITALARHIAIRDAAKAAQEPGAANPPG